MQCDAVCVASEKQLTIACCIINAQTGAPLLALRFGITLVLHDWTARFICFIMRKDGFLLRYSRINVATNLPPAVQNF